MSFARKESSQNISGGVSMSPASDHAVTSSRWLIAAAVLPLGLFLLLAEGTSRPALAQTAQSQPAPAKASAAQSEAKQKTFSSPQDATAALYQAARNNDEDGMLVILGPGARDLILWTDNPADRKADTDFFADKYEQMHRLVKEPDDETTLYVGAENWPLPIPLIEKNGMWSFDASLGAQEIVYRRIGENEMNGMDVLRGLAEAENEFYDNEITGAPAEYAPRFNSDQGTHDGLYWPVSEKDTPSPVGHYVAEASYDHADHKPLHGYYFRLLMEQGPAAPGGARKYVVNNKMTGGFAFVAFPAEYRSSGVKTFIICHDGAVYEKDLGPNTVKIASSMTAYNPDSSWTRVP
jgi:Protein of unknown function (DUF2950)